MKWCIFDAFIQTQTYLPATERGICSIKTFQLDADDKKNKTNKMRLTEGKQLQGLHCYSTVYIGAGSLSLDIRVFEE